MTYSGDAAGVGIQPHRDAAFAGREARGLNVTGRCEFSLWEGCKDDAPTVLLLGPGDAVRFDCKRLHSASPGPGRWAIHTWQRGPKWPARAPGAR